MGKRKIVVLGRMTCLPRLWKGACRESRKFRPHHRRRGIRKHDSRARNGYVAAGDYRAGTSSGGTCLNRGCIPSKMLLYAAEVAEMARHGARLGVHHTLERVDWQRLVGRVWEKIDPIAEAGAQYRRSQPHVTVYDAPARFVAPARSGNGRPPRHRGAHRSWRRLKAGGAGRSRTGKHRVPHLGHHHAAAGATALAADRRRRVYRGGNGAFLRLTGNARHPHRPRRGRSSSARTTRWRKRSPVSISGVSTSCYMLAFAASSRRTTASPRSLTSLAHRARYGSIPCCSPAAGAPTRTV